MHELNIVELDHSIFWSVFVTAECIVPNIDYIKHGMRTELLLVLFILCSLYHACHAEYVVCRSAHDNSRPLRYRYSPQGILLMHK